MPRHRPRPDQISRHPGTGRTHIRARQPDGEEHLRPAIGCATWKNTFIVALRLAIVQNSDRILLHNENRLVVMGTHQELMTQNPYYKSLVANQQILRSRPT